MTELESWGISFFYILCSKIVEKCVSVTFKICHFKASEDFSTKIKWEPLDINTNEWQEVDDCCYPFSVINNHFKIVFCCYNFLNLLWENVFLVWITCFPLKEGLKMCRERGHNLEAEGREVAVLFWDTIFETRVKLENK